MTTRSTYDVAIIGGGIIGASAAFALAEEGLRLTLLDRQAPGREASWAAGGMLSPAPYLPNDAALVPLASESLRLYPGIIQAIESASERCANYRHAGAIELFFGAEAEAECSEYVAMCRGLKLEVESCSGDEARRREPAVALSVRAAAFFPAEGTAEPRALMEAVLEAARRRGVHLRPNCGVQSLIIERSRCFGVITDGNCIAADHVVIAAGCFSSALCDAVVSSGGLSACLPVRPVRGQMMALRPDDVTLRGAVRSSRGYLVPRPDGTIVAGSTLEEAGFEKLVTGAGMKKIREAAVELIPGLDSAEIVETWAGLRPGTPDGLPVLGPVEIEGVIVATGHFRNGILLAPVTAQLVKDWIINGKPGFPVDAFSPTRFAGKGISAEGT